MSSRRHGTDKGWTVKLSRHYEKLVKEFADREQRSIRVVIERALDGYMKLKTNGRDR